jgi:hypothetical protein
MDEETGKVIRRIGDNAKILYDGYYENVEYAVDVAYHRAECVHHGKSALPRGDCECPVVTEQRVRKIKRRGLLAQLREFNQNKDTDRNPKAERGAPRVKVAGRPPGDMGGFFALDEIMCDIPYVVDRVLEEVGRDRTWAAAPVGEILMGLASQCHHFAEARPDQLREVDKAAARWVATARSTLKITVGDAIFDKIVCGNCGGGLATPWGNRGESDVVCVGTPGDPPCGHAYPMSEWVKLYEDQKRGVDS